LVSKIIEKDTPKVKVEKIIKANSEKIFQANFLFLKSVKVVSRKENTITTEDLAIISIVGNPIIEHSVFKEGQTK
jgi:hypothetical protein